MVRRLEPVKVLAYGRLPAACAEQVEVICYPTRWTNIRAARARPAGIGRLRQDGLNGRQ